MFLELRYQGCLSPTSAERLLKFYTKCHSKTILSCLDKMESKYFSNKCLDLGFELCHQACLDKGSRELEDSCNFVLNAIMRIVISNLDNLYTKYHQNEYMSVFRIVPFGIFRSLES